MRGIFVILIIFCFTSTSIAQATGEDKFGTWALYFGTNRVSEDFSLHTELQLNHYEFFNNYNQFWAIVLLNYHLSDNVVVSGGYGYFNTDPTFLDVSGLKDIDENRLMEQIVVNQSLGKLNMQHRYRFEQRFLNTTNGTPTRHRFRYRLQLTHPLSPKWFVIVFDEIFLNLQEPTFDQNRLFLALGYNLSERVSVQTGYLKLHFTGRHYDRIQFVLNINTDFRKKQSETIEP